LKERTAKFGADHPATLRAQGNLGVNYRDSGRPSEGAHLMEEALRRARGRPEAMAVLGELPTALAMAYDACGQLTRSEPLYREQVATGRELFGPDNPRTVNAIRALGWNLLRQERWSDAEPIFRESLAIATKTEPDSWYTFNNQWLLGGALVRQGKYAEAEPLLVQGYEGMRAREATVPSGRANLTAGVKRLISIYEQRQRWHDAASWRARLGLPDPDATMPNGLEAFAR
jgi:tetratricopeptide (TPR) repeat protein